MKIFVLCNDEARKGFRAEHGLSLLLDAETLFDTGSSDVAIFNAEKLGVDFQKIKRVIISHGHYDHGGGLLNFLKRTGKIDVYIHRKALTPKYSGKRFAGFPYDWDEVEKMAQIHFIDGDTHIDELYVLNDVATDERFIDPAFNADGRHDLFEDELNLYVHGTLITGCAHRGIDNILKAAQRTHNVRNVIGGFHLKDSSYKRIEDIVNTFSISNVQVFPLHCTGKVATDFIKESLKERCTLLKAGDVLKV